VFPTNLGVNPQHSIMAVVFRAAEQLANTTQTRPTRAARADSQVVPFDAAVTIPPGR
jgi:choline dehydrogenase-like flavoprotein